MKQNIRILGTKYKIEARKLNEDAMLMDGVFGYCDRWNKVIVVRDYSDGEFDDMSTYEKYYVASNTLRHELVHAFLCESGLCGSSNKCDAWTENEEMIDWFAIQLPKIYKLYKKLGILEGSKLSDIKVFSKIDDTV